MGGVIENVPPRPPTNHPAFPTAVCAAMGAIFSDPKFHIVVLDIVPAMVSPLPEAPEKSTLRPTLYISTVTVLLDGNA